ncbi:hypothetical protein X975_08591, partial [Stegodyphus mimosarum]
MLYTDNAERELSSHYPPDFMNALFNSIGFNEYFQQFTSSLSNKLC